MGRSKRGVSAVAATAAPRISRSMSAGAQYRARQLQLAREKMFNLLVAPTPDVQQVLSDSPIYSRERLAALLSYGKYNSDEIADWMLIDDAGELASTVAAPVFHEYWRGRLQEDLSFLQEHYDIQTAQGLSLRQTAVLAGVARQARTAYDIAQIITSSPEEERTKQALISKSNEVIASQLSGTSPKGTSYRNALLAVVSKNFLDNQEERSFLARPEFTAQREKLSQATGLPPVDNAFVMVDLQDLDMVLHGKSAFGDGHAAAAATYMGNLDIIAINSSHPVFTEQERVAKEFSDMLEHIVTHEMIHGYQTEGKSYAPPVIMLLEGATELFNFRTLGWDDETRSKRSPQYARYASFLTALAKDNTKDASEDAVARVLAVGTSDATRLQRATLLATGRADKDAQLAMLDTLSQYYAKLEGTKEATFADDEFMASVLLSDLRARLAG